MKKLIISIGAALCAAISAWAGTQTIDGRDWTYGVSGGEASIIYVEGPMSGEVAIPATLGGYPVTVIVDGAFEGCSRLRSVLLPDGLKKIGAMAFQDCTALTSVTIPAGVTEVGEGAFAGCTGLKSATVPQCVCDDGVWFAFDADNITKVVIADGATAIGDYAFEGCYNLALVTIPSTVQFIGDHAFEACYALKRVTIPEGVEEIGAAAFMDCFDLESVTLPSGLTTIWANAFAGCLSLASVSLPDGLTLIGASAFEDCYSLSRLMLPAQLGTIGPGAFRNSGLTSAVLPDSVGEIGEGVFAGCTGLSRVTITQKILDLGVRNVFDTNLAADIVIADGVERIPDMAFEGFAKITSVTLPESVQAIGFSAFRDCRSLASVNLPGPAPELEGYVESGVSSIGDLAFYGCRSLTTLEIPATVYEVGERAFFNCYALKDVTLPLHALDCTFDGERGVWVVGGAWGVFGTDERPSAWESLTVLDGDRYWNGESVGGRWWESGTYPAVLGEYAFSDLGSLRAVTLPTSVAGVGAWAFKGCAKLESVTLADAAADWYGGGWDRNRDFEGEVGEEAFAGCASLVRVDIPENVTRIGTRAFAGCAKLTDAELPDSVMSIGDWSFAGCVKLTSVNFPDSVWMEGFNEPFGGVRFIGYGAFDHCIGLTGVDIPDCVEEIGGRAFGDCYGLKDVILPKRVFDCGLWDVFSNDDPYYQEQGYRRAWENVTVGEGVEYIGECMFEGMLSIRTVMVPRSVRGIGMRAFKDCAKLENVMISQGAGWHGEYDSSFALIGDSAFENCGKLTNVAIPDGVTEIGNRAFRFSGLASVAIPDSVTRIGNEAFEGCGLTIVTIPDGVTSIGGGAFCVCERLERVMLPASVTDIGWDAFRDCYGLKELILPKCVVDVGLWNVFPFGDSERPCAWESVTLLDGWTAVDDNLFAGLQNLKSVTLPASVRTIGAGAFSGCVGMRDMTFGGNAPSAIGVDAFSGISPNCTAWVKKGSTGWGGEIAGRWQGMKIDYQPSSLYLPALSYGANVVATQTDRGWTVASANGSVLTRSALTSLKVNVTLPDGSEVETTRGYEKVLSLDGSSVELCLKTPEIALAAETGNLDEDDPSGLLVDVPEALLATKPAAGEGESVGALPVKAVKGLWYQVSWGGDLKGLTQGEKVQATSDSLYLGVIKQTGSSGFYRLSVSEK